MMKFKFSHIVFDLDGVIIDSFGVMKVAFDYAFNKVVGSGTPPFEEYKRHMGRKLTEILEIMNLPEAMIEPFITESKRHIQNIKVYEGIFGVLDSLRQYGIGMGIATGKDTERAVDILKHLNLNHYFQLVVGSNAVEKPKPHGQMLKYHLECSRSSQAETLFIGDSLVDLEEGRNAGVKIAAALWGQGTEAELLSYQPDFLLKSPQEILNIL